MKRVSIMEILPPECIYAVLLHLDVPEICSAASVCTVWYQLMTHNMLFYKQMISTRYEPVGPIYLPDGKTWKWALQCKIPFTNPLFSGTGKKMFSCGVYEGDWLNGKRNGKGSFTWHCGVYYQGTWDEDKFSGHGTAVWQCGRKYVGEWVEAKMSGRGKFYWPSGDTYEGEWHDNNRNGQGKFTWQNGNVYEGSWVNDERHGSGRLVWKVGDVYIGEWRNGTRTGFGYFRWNNGDSYIGEWKDGLQTGLGCLTWCNGNKYTGRWEQGDNTDGVFYEALTNLSFTRKQTKKDQAILPECMNPDINALVTARKCTYSFTKEQNYFQYLYKHAPIDDRTRGICVSCHEVCLNQNNIKLFKKKAYFGGNFYCDCGAGNLEYPCRALDRHVTHVRSRVNSNDQANATTTNTNTRLSNSAESAEEIAGAEPTALPPQQHEQHQMAQI